MTVKWPNSSIFSADSDRDHCCSDFFQSMSKWRACVFWLKEIGFLPSKHRILRTDTVLSDLVDLLQDGSVLCYVLHFIDPSSIDIRRVHNHSYGSEISSVRNANLFLQACIDVYKIPKSCLFEASDLFNRVKFENVLSSLNEISKSSHYIASRISSGKSPTSFELSVEESDNYSDLEDKISDLKIEDEDTIYGQVDHESEDIYDELIYSRYKGLDAFDDSSEERPLTRDKRSLIINELVETEKEYVRVLDVIVNHYCNNLKSIVPQDKLLKIFCNGTINNLLEYHAGLFDDMRNAVDSGHPVAGTLIVWQPKLANYAHYFAALDDAMSTIESCSKDAVFRKRLDYLKETADIQQCRFNLSDVLRVPGQRILKYHLLIDSLKKAIPTEDFHELSTTETACEKLKDLNSYMNESKRDAELKRKLMTLRESIQDAELFKDVLCYGKLVKDGELKVKFNSESTMKKCHVFLFQRGLLFSKDRSDFLSSSKNFESKFKALFSEYDVDENNTQLTFIILKHKFEGNKHVTLICKNSNFQSDWLNCIKDASASSDRDKLCFNRHQFELASFIEVKKCYFCDKLLKGAFCQGYRCRNCQNLSHRECLARHAICRSRRISRDPQLTTGHKPMLVVKPQPQSEHFSSWKNGPSTVYQATMPLNQPECLFILPGEVFEVFHDDMDCHFGLKARKMETGEFGYVPMEYIQLLNKPNPNLDLTDSVDASSGSPKRHSFEESLIDYPWFTHVQSRETSSKNCLICPDSTFLVRKSESAMTFALMVHHNKVVRNIRIETNHEGRWYVAPEINFPTIPDLVDFYQCNSLQSNFPQLPTTLVTPFYEGVQKLKSQLLKPVQPGNKTPLYVGLGQMIQSHKSTDSREVDVAVGEIVKIVSFYSYSVSFCSVEVLKKYEVNNRDPEYLPVRGIVPNSKVKVF